MVAIERSDAVFMVMDYPGNGEDGGNGFHTEQRRNGDI